MTSMLRQIVCHYWKVAKHKWFVMRAGRWSGASWYRLIVHDFSKFGPSEAPAYAGRFCGDGVDDLGFSYAWNHHQKTNKHHWEYWVLGTGQTLGGLGAGKALPIPEAFIREMVADWFGASRGYEGVWPHSRKDWKWYQHNIQRINLHPDTRVLLEQILDETFEAKDASSPLR